jgi:hypothetical protein
MQRICHFERSAAESRNLLFVLGIAENSGFLTDVRNDTHDQLSQIIQIKPFACRASFVVSSIVVALIADLVCRLLAGMIAGY